MKRTNVGKRIVVFFMVATLMLMTNLRISKEVYAVENESPDITEFATVDQLRSFNTDDTDGSVNPAKVYFGNNNQQWWIAGSQSNDSITLFTASVLERGVVFESDVTDWDKKDYDPNWNCEYPEGSNIEKVNPNHYGGSPIRNKLENLLTSYFTNEEQKFMKSTTIYTLDSYNSRAYSTTDILYLPYGNQNFGREHINVGTNGTYSDVLNTGLRIDINYCGTEIFWLRAPSSTLPYKSTIMYGYVSYVSDWAVEYGCGLAPAFKLDLSSALFASCAMPATSNGAMTLSDTDGDGAFTIRYQGNVGTATLSGEYKSVSVSGITNDNTYLVVQNSEGAWAKKVSNNDLLFASEISDSLSSFENCKVWLETTSDRITYANLASYNKRDINVKFKTGVSMNITSNNGSQTGVWGSIEPIEVTVNDGYYLPDDYIDKIMALNVLEALQITKTDNGFMIQGTPNSDVYLSLPEATAYIDGNTIINPPTNLTAVYGQKLSDINLPNGWTWSDEDTAVSVGEKTYPARFDVSAYEDEYGFANVEGYNAQGHYVERNLTVNCSKADSKVTIKTQSLDKEYDGNAVNTPDVDKTGSSKDYKVTWYEKTNNGWSELASAPVNSGNYKVVVSLEADDNYSGASDELEFNISKLSNEWVDNLSIIGWTYGEQGNTPKAVSKYGVVKYTYSDKVDGTYKETVPTNAGTWYVKATVEENKNYMGLEAIKSFEIKKAVPEYEIPNQITIEKGKSLSTIKLPEGFSWKDENQIADKLGNQQFKAFYTPSDTQNYEVVEINITVNVFEKSKPSSDSDKNENIDNGGDKTNNTQQSDRNEKVETNDNTNIFVWSILIIISVIGILSLVIFGKRKLR